MDDEVVKTVRTILDGIPRKPNSYEIGMAIEGAILAERKRCAEVARSWEETARGLAKKEKDGERALYHHLAADMARDVAACIESGQ